MQAGQGAHGDSGRQRCRSVDGKENKHSDCRTVVMLGQRKSRRLADVFSVESVGTAVAHYAMKDPHQIYSNCTKYRKGNSS